MVRLCGAALGFLAFGVTVLLGLFAGNPVETILLRAVWALVLFCAGGLLVGWIAWRVLDDHAQRRYRELFEGADEPGDSTEASADPTPPGGTASSPGGTTAGRSTQASRR